MRLNWSTTHTGEKLKHEKIIIQIYMQFAYCVMLVHRWWSMWCVLRARNKSSMVLHTSAVHALDSLFLHNFDWANSEWNCAMRLSRLCYDICAKMNRNARRTQHGMYCAVTWILATYISNHFWRWPCAEQLWQFEWKWCVEYFNHLKRSNDQRTIDFDSIEIVDLRRCNGVMQLGGKSLRWNRYVIEIWS